MKTNIYSNLAKNINVPKINKVNVNTALYGALAKLLETMVEDLIAIETKAIEIGLNFNMK